MKLFKNLLGGNMMFKRIRINLKDDRFQEWCSNILYR